MADHLLNAIIALEKDLQTQVGKELSLAEAWRERQLAALAREDAQVRTELMAVRGEQVERARQAGARESEEALAAVRSWCLRLESLPDETCLTQLRPLLRRLLPEVVDDHPHGQD